MPAPGSDAKHYDAVGAFQVTRISPVHVSTAGGTTVTVSGTALEAGVSVRIGATRVADVLSSSATAVVFRAPAALAGTYDVTLFKNGRSSVLSQALVYGDGAGPQPGGGTTPAPGSGPSPAPSTPAPAPTSPPGGGTPAPGVTPTPAGPTPTPTRRGPNGERLVHNDSLAALAGLWATDCSAGCRGVQV
ncbi:IPT/TIG domain-containing protein [Cellulomonas cellasea]|uniref:IPT/TIG domain-containing protein n=1 Tax=Cellulomonas cellasea DSM 20118 TaxID=1408250 RepID=A0A0A0B349_9CELL|nr:IPT/TIG domain-containing protein [Cellulomonas cellasea]KGM00553.1 hypothetical protein Q760_08100 [Cellulomonas cellasea DSM 20118]